MIRRSRSAESVVEDYLKDAEKSLRDESIAHLSLENLNLSPIVKPTSPAFVNSTIDELDVSKLQETVRAMQERFNHSFNNPSNDVALFKSPMRAIVSSSNFGNANRHSFHGGMLAKCRGEMALNKCDEADQRSEVWSSGTQSPRGINSRKGSNRNSTMLLPNSPIKPDISHYFQLNTDLENVSSVQDTNSKVGNHSAIITNEPYKRVSEVRPSPYESAVCLSAYKSVADAVCSTGIRTVREACNCSRLFCKSCSRDESSSSRLTNEAERSVYIVNKDLYKGINTLTTKFQDHEKSSSFKESKINGEIDAKNVILNQVPAGGYVYNNAIYSRPVKKPALNICNDIGIPILENSARSTESEKNYLRSKSAIYLGLPRNNMNNTNSASSIVSSIASSMAPVSLNSAEEASSITGKPPLPPRNTKQTSMSSTQSSASNLKLPSQSTIYQVSSQDDAIDAQPKERIGEYYVPPPPVQLKRRFSGERGVLSQVFSDKNPSSKGLPNLENKGFASDVNESVTPYQVPPPPKHLRASSDSSEAVGESRSRSNSLTIFSNLNLGKMKLDSSNRKKLEKSISNICEYNSENKENVPANSHKSEKRSATPTVPIYIHKIYISN